MKMTLVSGMSGEVRILNGRELLALSTPGLARNGGAVEMFLRNCWSATENPGPYRIEPGGKPNWDTVLLGDRFDALCQLRGLTFGEDYFFRVQCAAGRCREMYDWQLNLANLPRKELSKASFAQLQIKNEFICEAPDGRIVTFRLPLGSDEKAANKKRKAQGGQWGHLDALQQYILSVDGVGTAKDEKKILAYLEDLAWPDVLGLLETFNAEDCGLEIKIETECTHCRWQQEILLPFDEDFFRARTKKSTTQTAAGMKPTENVQTGSASAQLPSSRTSGEPGPTSE